MKKKYFAVAILLSFFASLALIACSFDAQQPTHAPVMGALQAIQFAGDLDGSYVSQTVVGLEGKTLPSPATGALQYDGGALYWAPISTVGHGTAGQVLATNDAGAATTWVYPHGDVDASATDPGAITVNAIQGYGVSSSTPSTGNALVYSSGLWRPGDLLALFSGVTPEKFGAVGDCSTNDNAAFVNALATGFPVWLSAKCYVVTGFTITNAGQSIIGMGQQSILKTTTNGPLITIRADTGATKTLLRDFKVLGSGAGASQVAIANGISSTAGSGDGRLVVDDISFESTGGDSIQLFNQDTTNAGYHIGTRVTNSRFDLCGASGSGYCIDVQTGAEYVSVSQPSIYGGHGGIYIGAGNFVGGGGGNIDACGYAIEIGAVANDAHGAIADWNINHNAHAVYAHGNLNGFDFVGDHMFYGDMILGDSGGDGSVGLAFIGGQIDVTDIYFEGSTGVKFLGVTWPSANANTMHASYTYASTQWFDGMNVDYTGATPSFITTISAPSFANPALRWAAAVVSPTIQTGTSATSLTMNTNKSGAALQLGGDAAANVAKLTTAFEHQTYADFDAVSAPGSPGSTQRRMYVDSADNKLKVKDNLGNITVLTP